VDGLVYAAQKKGPNYPREHPAEKKTDILLRPARRKERGKRTKEKKVLAGPGGAHPPACTLEKEDRSSPSIMSKSLYFAREKRRKGRRGAV